MTNPKDINACFAKYYATLYSSTSACNTEELDSFLGSIDFPVLSDQARQMLDAPLTLKEIQKALRSLQTWKTPGDDGLPSEFYKCYGHSLTDELREVLVSSMDATSLPESMSQAIIVVVPKLGKDLELCSSYGPISLLNFDANILTRVLASCLNRVILLLIHRDQTGFMPGKGTDINLRRLYTIIANVRRSGVPG